MGIETLLSCSSGTIEVEKLRELFHEYNQDDLFNSFFEYCLDKEVNLGKRDDKVFRFSYESQDGCSYWLSVEFEPSVAESLGINRTMRVVDIDYFDPKRDYRNG